MRKFRLFKALQVMVMVVVGAGVFGEIVMHLWNWLMPTIFGLKSLTFVQALGLLLLTKILFGGFHRHSGGRNWKRQMGERFANMTVEERERFRSGMRGWRECGFGPAQKPRSETATL